MQFLSLCSGQDGCWQQLCGMAGGCGSLTTCHRQRRKGKQGPVEPYRRPAAHRSCCFTFILSVLILVLHSAQGLLRCPSDKVWRAWLEEYIETFPHHVTFSCSAIVFFCTSFSTRTPSQTLCSWWSQTSLVCHRTVFTCLFYLRDMKKTYITIYQSPSALERWAYCEGKEEWGDWTRCFRKARGRESFNFQFTVLGWKAFI